MLSATAFRALVVSALMALHVFAWAFPLDEAGEPKIPLPEALSPSFADGARRLDELTAEQASAVLQTPEERASRLLATLIRIAARAEAERRGMFVDGDVAIWLLEEPELRQSQRPEALPADSPPGGRPNPLLPELRPQRADLPGGGSPQRGSTAPDAGQNWRPDPLNAVSDVSTPRPSGDMTVPDLSLARQAELIASLPLRPVQLFTWVAFAIGVAAIGWIGWRAAG